MNPLQLRGIRGATTIAQNTPQAVIAGVTTLVHTLIERNALQVDAVATVFFTVTPDITCVSPGKALRQNFPNWQDVPIFCAQEPFIEDLPERCIRILVQFNTTQPRSDIAHVYLEGAQVLRPDWVK